MNRLTISTLLMLCMMCQGCIDEDRSGCDRGHSLELSYMGDGSTQIFSQKIENVMLYVFDETVTCVVRRAATPDEVRSRSVSLAGLSEGRYRVVCLGNARNTEVAGYTDCCAYTEIHFGARSYFEGKQTATNDSLYYASTALSVESRQGGHTTVEFRSSHYKVYAEAVGFDPDALPHVGVPTIRMTGIQPCTNFENATCMNRVTYYPVSSPYDSDKHQICSRFNIMRHCRSREVAIELLDAVGDVIAHIDMIDFLAEHPEINLSKQEVLIPVSFRYKDAGVEITVPEWYVNEVVPEI